jgi:glycosyltransferase involved in cell wall biosynthesis
VDKLRVLLLAEHCNPTWPSVPLVGYHQVRALPTRDDLAVTLVTHVNNRAALAGDPLSQRADIHFVDNEWLARPIWKLSKLLRGGEKLAWTVAAAMSWPASIVFELQAHARLSHQLSAGRFDIVHRLTPLTPTIGMPFAVRTQVPSLLGPLNGGLPWPKEYPELRRREREWLAPLRQAYRLMPYFRATYQHLAGVISGSRHTASEIPRHFGGRRYYLPENGIDPERFPLASAWPEPQKRFRFVTIGRLVPYKGFDLTLEAMGQSDALRQCELVIIGDGPQRAELESLTDLWKLRDVVHFRGNIDNAAIAKELRSAQVFVFPSLREFGGGVVLEAMASGLPCVVVDYGGPAELVNSDSGILLPMRRRDEMVANLRAAMESLASDSARCRTMSAAGVARVRDHFTWSAKADRIAAIYRDIV